MDDWTHPYQDVDVHDAQPPLLHEDGRVDGGSPRPLAAGGSRPRGRTRADQALDAVGSPAEADVPLPFATPPGVALTF